MTYPNLERPASVGEAQWEVIARILQRMSAARSGGDHELVVGSAKELIECVAKVVLDARGVAFGNATSFPKLVNEAHVALGRQPGSGLATDPPVRDIAQAVKQVALGAGELRNSHGTGHGRTQLPDVVAEHAELTTDAALLWTRWALRRVDVIVEGRAADIIAALRGPTSFFKHDLARRLEAADLASLDEADLTRLGLAVGQRAARATFTVLEDGVESAAALAAPLAYRLGVIEGVFLDPDGYVRTTLSAARGALNMLRTLDGGDACAALDRVIAALADAEFSYAFEVSERQSVANELLDRSDSFASPVRERVESLAELVRT